MNEPVGFRTNGSEITARVTRIMKDFVRSVNLLIATPVAAYDKLAKAPFQP